MSAIAAVSNTSFAQVAMRQQTGAYIDRMNHFLATGGKEMPMAPGLPGRGIGAPGLPLGWFLKLPVPEIVIPSSAHPRTLYIGPPPIYGMPPAGGAPVNPVDPADPVDPIDPLPVDPVDPTEPVDPVDPGGPRGAFSMGSQDGFDVWAMTVVPDSADWGWYTPDFTLTPDRQAGTVQMSFAGYLEIALLSDTAMGDVADPASLTFSPGGTVTLSPGGMVMIRFGASLFIAVGNISIGLDGRVYFDSAQIWQTGDGDGGDTAPPPFGMAPMSVAVIDLALAHRAEADPIHVGAMYAEAAGGFAEAGDVPPAVGDAGIGDAGAGDAGSGGAPPAV